MLHDLVVIILTYSKFDDTIKTIKEDNSIQTLELRKDEKETS